MAESPQFSIENLLDIIARQFRDPLRQMKFHQQALINDGHIHLGEGARSHLQGLSAASDQVQDMFGALQQYCGIGQSEKAFMETNLNSILQKSVRELDLAKTANLELIIHGNLPWLPCDKKLVRELFCHLLANALQYNKRPRRKIEVGLASACGVKFETPARVRGEVLFVRDNGTGIRRKQQPNLFQPFTRCHSQQKYGPGLGMGLALCKKIVEYHGGKIWCQTQPGKGSTFFFTLS